MLSVGDELRARIRKAHDVEEAARLVVAELSVRVPHYSWVGIRWLEGDDLVLGPWAGPDATEHTRIPLDPAGGAAARGRTEIVSDVSKGPRYPACFPSTRSEILVPITRPDGVVIGEIDIDSDRLAAFSTDDVTFLERIAGDLGSRAVG